jgi:hypothetical protein
VVGEEAPAGVVAEDAVADGDVVTLVDAQGGAVRVRGAEAVDDDVRREGDVDGVAVVGAVAGRQDVGVRARRADGERGRGRAAGAAQVEAEVVAVGDEDGVAGAGGDERAANLPERTRLRAVVAVVTRRGDVEGVARRARLTHTEGRGRTEHDKAEHRDEEHTAV